MNLNEIVRSEIEGFFGKDFRDSAIEPRQRIKFIRSDLLWKRRPSILMRNDIETQFRPGLSKRNSTRLRRMVCYRKSVELRPRKAHYKGFSLRPFI